MMVFFLLRNILAILLVAFGLSACVSPKLHSVNDALPTDAQLLATIDREYDGSAVAFLTNTFYQPERTWGGGHVLWADQMFAQQNRQDLLRALEARGWDANTAYHADSYQPLRLAIESGSTAAVQSLIAVGADPDRLEGTCSRPCTMCQDLNRYLCSSALTLVVLAGQPGMLQPVLEASDTIAWREVDHARGVSSEAITGERAIFVGVNRAFNEGRGSQFGPAFSAAGYTSIVTAAYEAHQDRLAVAAAAGSSPQRGAAPSSGAASAGSPDNGMAEAGMAAAIGLGLGAIIGGDMDVTSAMDMANTVVGSGAVAGMNDGDAGLGSMIGVAQSVMGSGAVAGTNAGDTGIGSMIGVAQSVMGSGNVAAAGDAETAVMSMFIDTMLQAVEASNEAEADASTGTVAATPTSQPTKTVSAGKTGSTQSGASSTVASSNTTVFAIDEMYRPTCPDGRRASNDIPIKTNLPNCANTMRVYARAASCNLVDELAAAEQAYYSACASEIYQ